MEILEVANNHPKRGLCIKNFLLSWSFRLRRCPPLPNKEMEEKLWNTGEWQVISEAWPWITYTFHTKDQPLHPSNFTGESQEPLQNHQRHHLDILSRTLLIINLLLFNLTILNPILLQPTLHTHNSTSGISPNSEPSLKPSEAGNEPLCRQPHLSVGPTAGTKFPEEDG